jgi:transposase
MAEQSEVQEASDATQQTLLQLVKTDRDPRVRRRAQAVLLVEEGHPVAEVARLLHTGASCVRRWRTRFREAGRAGLADRPRVGRSAKLDAEARAWLQAALEAGPQAYGLLSTVWCIRDLQAVLERERGVQVSEWTVYRAVRALGYRYRRPRHDLTHRQDPAAVAATREVLRWLQKKRLLDPSDSIWSTWMSASSTPIPTWHRSGGARGSQ